MRLVELQNERDSVEACAAAGRAVADENLRGWAALVPLEPPVVAEGLRHAGLAVLRGSKSALVLGSIAQLWSAARSLADALERKEAKALAGALRDRAAAIETGAPAWILPRSTLPRGRTLVMGVVNVTPDSFSDGGLWRNAGAAIEHGLRLVAEGADILDVGGESTRPNAAAVSAEDERARIEPVVRELSKRAGVPVSIDTTKSEIAEAAIDAGAEIVNDVSGLARDPHLAEVVARTGAALCLMHMRGTPADMQQRATYADLMAEVLTELGQALDRAGSIAKERIAIDPGLGFAKTAEQNLLVLRRLRDLTQLGRPLVVGPSRKAFLGKLSGKPPAERVIGTAAAAALAARAGALVVRVHDVAAVREALAVADAVSRS